MTGNDRAASVRRDLLEIGALLALDVVFGALSHALDPASSAGNLAALAGVASGVILVLVLHRRRRDSWDVLGLGRPKSWPKTILLGLGATLAIFVIVGGIQQLLLNPALAGEQPDTSRFDSLQGNLPRLIQAIVAVWFSAGFAEELIYRGFLMGRLANVFGNGRGAWIGSLFVSSAIFSLLHLYQGLAGVLVTGLAGFVLGAVYLLVKRNLWVGIVAHGLTDSVSFVLIYLGMVG